MSHIFNAIRLVQVSDKSTQSVVRFLRTSRIARNHEVQETVAPILAAVRAQGDRALIHYTRLFDNKLLNSSSMRLDHEHIAQQARLIDPALRKTIRVAATRIRTFHEYQKHPLSYSIKTPEGTLKQRVVPINRVGIYIPGGHTCYPSSVLMNVIPAQIAGVEQIVAVTPVREALNPALAYIFNMLKIDEIYQIGGAQAIAALAYGTETIEPVDKIVGPGNAYVAAAKRQVFGLVDIDMVAGPSEVVILADRSVPAEWVALDMLSQAEHGSGDEIAICVTEDPSFGREIRTCLVREIEQSKTRAVFQALKSAALTIVVTRNRQQSISLINTVAPEHLQIMTSSAHSDSNAIRNAAAQFLGPFTPVALGDYFIGTNHVLPTGSASRYASALGVYSFQKHYSIAQVSRAGLHRAAEHVSRFARAENFIHHALSVERRVQGKPPTR